jgi:circadian clock protein KaiC
MEDASNGAGGRLLGTGVSGLDDVLRGGLPGARMYLVEGDPGAGKTTLALQFLREAVRLGQRALYITLSETRDELIAVCHSHGWSLDGIDVHEVSAALVDDEDNTLFVPGDIELGERAREMLAEVERVGPSRIVLDSCTELRLLAQSQLRFRRQLLALKEALVKRGCTILLLDNPAGHDSDALLQSLVHGVIHMEQLSPEYGSERRRLRVNKLREVQFRGGYHDFVIRKGGLAVFPRLVAAEHHETVPSESLKSGVSELDDLLGGGLPRGSRTLMMGPAGSLKSSLAIQYASALARGGERAALFLFDEDEATMVARSEGLGMPVRRYVSEGLLQVRQVDPAELSPGELTHIIRESIERGGARMIVIDSLNGYLHAMAQEKLLVLQLHELLSYLRQVGVATVMVVALHGLVGQQQAPIDVSYLADNVILMRYFEAHGRVRRAVSMVKKRTGRHEDTIRELSIENDRLLVGPALDQFRGVLTGSPEFIGDRDADGREPD